MRKESMPGRKVKFLNESVYHVFNKTIDRRKIFRDMNLSELFHGICKYYRTTKPVLSFSKYRRLHGPLKNLYEKELELKEHFQVDILCFCIMPTHFHFLLKQKKTNGISKFISDITNSFTRYVNIKTERKGPIFLLRFKAVPIVTQEQLLHVSRYIHLNPYSSDIINTTKELEFYKWSSFPSYINKYSDSLTQREYIMALFNNNPKRYKEFVYTPLQPVCNFII